MKVKTMKIYEKFLKNYEFPHFSEQLRSNKYVIAKLTIVITFHIETQLNYKTTED